MKSSRSGPDNGDGDRDNDDMDRVRNLTASQLKSRLIQIVHNKGIFNSMKVLTYLQ